MDFLQLPLTNLFNIEVARESTAFLDNQTIEARWLSPGEWVEYKLVPFIYYSVSCCMAIIEGLQTK